MSQISHRKAKGSLFFKGLFYFCMGKRRPRYEAVMLFMWFNDTSARSQGVTLSLIQRQRARGRARCFSSRTVLLGIQRKDSILHHNRIFVTVSTQDGFGERVRRDGFPY